MELPARRFTRPFPALMYTVLLSACTVTEKNSSDTDAPSDGGHNGSNGQAGASGSAAGATDASNDTVAGSTTVGGSGSIGAAGSQGGSAGHVPAVGGSGGTAAQGGMSAIGASAGRNSAGVVGGTSNSVAGSGSNPAGGSSSAAGGAASTGSLPSELIGVWQQTRASAGDYVSSNGTQFSLTSGFSVQLKMSSNGAYYLATLGSGVTPTCASVSNFEESVGKVELVGDSLVFHPTAHRLDVTDCTGSKHTDLGVSPFALAISLQEAQHLRGGIRTYRMLANGGPHPYDLMLVHRPPLGDPPVVPQPADFTLGADDPYQEFQGLWVSAPGTDANFFDPATGNYYFPTLNGAAHVWLRMFPDGYETAIALQNVNSDGPCKSDVIYYEQGEAKFAVLEDLYGAGNHFLGSARFQSTAARLIVRIRECGESDATIAYDLPPVPRYFRFIYNSVDNPPESIAFPCDFPLNEWQAILCEEFPHNFSRR